VRDMLNKMFIADNGTNYLVLAYEEVIMPLILTGKKKYCGAAHLKTENFHPTLKEIFVRGIDGFVKSGQSGIAREVIGDLMLEGISVYNDKTLIELVKEKLTEIYSKQWDTQYFAMTGKYKPARANIKMHTFHRRMSERAALYKTGSPFCDPIKEMMFKPPASGDPFQYVIVEVLVAFNIRGCRIKISKGDQMEYLDAYLASLKTDKPMRIDLSHYMEGAIYGQFARFISGNPEFRADQSLSNYDELEVTKSKQFIVEYCRDLVNFDPAAIRKCGYAFRKLTNRVNKRIAARVPLPAYLSIIDVVKPNKTQTHLDVAMAALTEFVIAAQPDYTGHGRGFIRVFADDLRRDPNYIFSLLKHYRVDSSRQDTPAAKRHAAINKAIKETTDQIRSLIPSVVKSFEPRARSIEDAIIKMRALYSDFKGVCDIDRDLNFSVVDEAAIAAVPDLLREKIATWWSLLNQRRVMHEVYAQLHACRIAIVFEPAPTKYPLLKPHRFS